MTKRQQIVLDIIEKLKSIKTGNGFNTNCGDIVEHWNKFIVPVENEESLNVCDEDTDFDSTTHNAHHKYLLINIELACAKKEESWVYATNIQADIYKCIGENINWFVDKYGSIKFEPAGDSLEIILEDKIYAEGSVRIEVQYKTEPWSS